jgi:DNA-binding response OmpR family regulator
MVVTDAQGARVGRHWSEPGGRPMHRRRTLPAPGALLIIGREGSREWVGHLRDALAAAGYPVEGVVGPFVGVDHARAAGADLMVVEVDPDAGSELDWVRRLRDDGNQALIVAVVSSADAETVVGWLTLGVDGCVTRECSANELVARIGALLRRGRPRVGQGATISIGDLQIQPPARAVLRGGSVVRLSRLEYDVFWTLARHRGRVVSRAEIVRDVWRRELTRTCHVLDNIIMSLRRKLEIDASAPSLIVTVRTAGYLLPK